MGDSMSGSSSSKKSKVASSIASRKENSRVIASPQKAYSQSSSSHIPSLIHVRLAKGAHVRLAKGATGQIAFFLLKVAALEMVRRISRSKCPVAWRGLQALQVLCYPPFKWIQKWAPFKGLVKGTQMLSRPLFVLSIATTFSDLLDYSNETLDDITNYSEPNSELPSASVESTSDTRICDESPQSPASDSWLLQLYKELENQGISLPERINEDELHQFYTAANGDFSCLLSSVKKTIRWRETYSILPQQELEIWSNLVFWHGFDVKHRPCLFVRLGLACFSLPSHDRPRFAQALVSQIEHGILHLVDAENAQITVLVDCEGLSPLRFPMQMMRSCSALLQDHFPNRLGCLLVIRLPPVVQVIAQTFIQVLKPVTREKLKIEREAYQKVLFEYFQTLPSYLGGKCTCKTCAIISNCNILQSHAKDETKILEPVANMTDDDDSLSSAQPTNQTDVDMNVNCDQVFRTAMISIVMFLVLVAVIAGLYDPEDRLFVPP